MNDVQKKNAAAMMETIKHFRERLDRADEQIKLLQRGQTMQGITIEHLREQLAIALAARGTGPTAR
jgi:transcriptional regulator of NAD metabolism